MKSENVPIVCESIFLSSGRKYYETVGQRFIKISGFAKIFWTCLEGRLWDPVEKSRILAHSILIEFLLPLKNKTPKYQESMVNMDTDSVG